MNRIDRLMAILTFLQSRKFITADQISERFEISVRTVYRDLKAIGEIGVPIGFENNKGYFIVEGYYLPPVSFTSDEANALVLMEAIASRFTDDSVIRHYQTAMTKVKSVLNASEKEKIEEMLGHIKTFKPEVLKNDFDYITRIQKCIADKIILKVEYENNNKIKTVRELEPIGLLFYSMNWHVIAWCHLREEYRDFRLSNIIRILNTESKYRVKNHMDIDKYLKTLSHA